MRLQLSYAVWIAVLLTEATFPLVDGRKSSGGGGRAPPSRRPTGGRRSGARPSTSRRRMPVEQDPYQDEYDEEEEEEDFYSRGEADLYDEEEENLYDDEEEEEDMYDDYEEQRPSSRRSSSSSRGSNSSRSRGGRPSSRKRGGPSSSSSSSRRSSRSSGRVVPYTNHRTSRRSARGTPQPSAFTRGLTALRDSIPDPTSLKDATVNSIAAAKSTTSRLSSNIYRDIKGLTSSELEQVMLKATKPDDTPVKGGHVERLVGVTYQISGRYDIYDAVLRKLWAKMVEKDWRTTIKALYILHRFAADGAPDHQAALKARLRELRRTRDPKRKDKYFNSKQLLAGDSTPDNIAYRAFLSRYAHYVLLRAQCFGGMFAEITTDPNAARKKSKNAKPTTPKPITSTCLKNEHLEASQMLLKAGVACSLKDDEICENTAIAMERVASDMIGLTTAVAKALNLALKGEDDSGDLDNGILKKWCEFYSDELLPKTKALVKGASPTLDAYGLFLPSRMGATVSQDLLQKGIKEGLEVAEDRPVEEEETSISSGSNNVEEEEDIESDSKEMEDAIQQEEIQEEEEAFDEYDEYEYDEEYYDEE